MLVETGTVAREVRPEVREDELARDAGTEIGRERDDEPGEVVGLVQPAKGIDATSCSR